MDKCDKYHLYDKWVITYNPVSGAPIRNTKSVGVCWGTKEQDECSCEGNRCNCDFYEDVRKNAQLDVQQEKIPQRISELINMMYSLELAEYIQEETKRADIIAELLSIKSIIERRNT